MDNIKYKITQCIDGGVERDFCYVEDLVTAAKVLSQLIRTCILKRELKLNTGYLDNKEFRTEYRVKLILEKDENFGLKEEYKKLKEKEFTPGLPNYYMIFNYWENFWDMKSDEDNFDIETTYYEEEGLERFVGLLYENRVRVEDLQRVIKEVREERENGD